ncbi:hypothetical protein FOL46_009201 [Perkinsus olseni]|uniref:Uncharacterized protein n=1 Tax=Perkinsus olseni TaxID=32597 RepID=A0A7J6MLD6_PEROL|nr:hypothetical protein FOL46_009201 [Perkinsus olseni]
MVETEPSSHNEEDAQWHRLKNQVDAKLSQLSNKMEAQVTKLSNRMAELSKEVKAEMAVLNNDVTRLKRRADASQNIRASERSCSGKTSYEFSASNPSNGIYSFKWRQEGQVDIQLSWSKTLMATRTARGRYRDDHVVTANIQREVETIYIECGRVTNLRSQHFSERRLSGTFVNPGLFGA